jgi:hypothetical protein
MKALKSPAIAWQRLAFTLAMLTVLSGPGCSDHAGPTAATGDPILSPAAHLGSIQIDSADFYDPAWWASPPAGIFEIQQVDITSLGLAQAGAGDFYAGVTVTHSVVPWSYVEGWAHMTIAAPSSGWNGSTSIDTGGFSAGGSYHRPIDFPFGCDAFAGHSGTAAAAGVIRWSPWTWPPPGPSVSFTRGPEPSGNEEIDECLNHGDPPPGGGGGGEDPPEGQWWCQWEEWGLFAFIDGSWVLVDSWWEESYCWFEEAS